MTTKAENKTAQKINIITDIHVLAQPKYEPRHLSMEDLAEWLEDWAKEFNEFIRDHRSQDPVTITVERERADVCSGCKCGWEPYTDDDGIMCCAGCGAVIEIEVSQ